MQKKEKKLQKKSINSSTDNLMGNRICSEEIEREREREKKWVGGEEITVRTVGNRYTETEDLTNESE